MPGSDVFAVLTEDHRNVERLFERFQQTNDPAVAREICDELTVHALAEEELVYPVLAVKVRPGLAREARHEHEEAKDIIEQIDAALAGGGDLTPLVNQLQQAVQHHVEEEESEVFPLMREKQPVMVEQMGDELVERKKELLVKVQEARSLGEPLSTIETTPPHANT